MGNKQSSSYPYGESRPQNNNNGSNNGQDLEDCNCTKPCFLLPSFMPRSSRSSDPIGSPLPDTPQFHRKRREMVQEVMASSKNQGVFSSRYNGLEKEVSTSTLIAPNTHNPSSSTITTTSSPGGDAQIHDGPHCEQLLHTKYQLLEVLGVGSTSTVHRCVCRANNKEYACKIIDCVLMEERFQGMMQQFQTEIEALRQLKHPNIIRLFDVYITEDKIFIVMELMEGGELFDYVVEKGTLTEEEAAIIVRKVTSALVYMHSENIVHRDLKPENLLLKRKPKGPNDDLDVKIIDFGLSKAMEEPVARTFLGTRGYLAPEMLQRRDYTRAVDTWALGVIVFVLLCGCLPFDDDSATVPSDDLVKAKFVLRFPRWAKNLSSSAKDLLSHLLDVNPRSRFTAEQALKHPWVQGETAPKFNMLASPGKIRKTPILAGSARNRTPANGTRKTPATPPTPPPNQMIRKTSI